MFHTYVCVLCCFNHFHGVSNGNETVNIVHWNMKRVFAYKFPYPFTVTQWHRLRSCILTLTNRVWTQIQKYIPKCRSFIKLYTNTSKVPDSHRNLSLMNLFSSTQQFIIQRAASDKILFHSLYTHTRQQIFQIVVRREKLAAHHSCYTRLNVSLAKAPLSILNPQKESSVSRGGNPDGSAVTVRWTPDHSTTAPTCVPRTQAA